MQTPSQKVRYAGCRTHEIPSAKLTQRDTIHPQLHQKCPRIICIMSSDVNLRTHIRRWEKYIHTLAADGVMDGQQLYIADTAGDFLGKLHV